MVTNKDHKPTDNFYGPIINASQILAAKDNY